MQHTDLFEECPECHSGHILYDHEHDEVFCYDCGLVLLRNYSFYIFIEDMQWLCGWVPIFPPLYIEGLD